MSGSANNVIKAYKGAVEPAASSASGNEIKLWKGAVEPQGGATFSGLLFGPYNSMPRDLSHYHDFIAAAGGDTTNSLQTDWRNALAAAIGYTQAQAVTMNIDDLWKEYTEAV